MKTCKSCLVTKDLSFFHRCTRDSDSVRGVCRECQSKADKVRHAKNNIDRFIEVLANGQKVHNADFDKTLPREDLAWAAGLIDGEGCIRISRSKPSLGSISNRHQLGISVGMTNKPTLDRLVVIFGTGAVKPMKTYGPKARKPMWIWKASSAKAEFVLNAVLPFLITKKKEAELALQFQLLHMNGGGAGNGQIPLPPDLLQVKDLWYDRLRAEKQVAFNEAGEKVYLTS